MSRSVVFPRQVRATIPDGVVQEIQRQIAAGTLKEGDRLPSVASLADDFGVSRASIREALQALAARGVVEIQHGRGTFVRADASRIDGYSTWIREQQYALQELCELRLAVETTAARLAAVKASPDELRTMADALAQMRMSVGDLHQVVVWDSHFHEAILSASHNRLLDQAMALDFDFLTQARYRMHSLPGEVERALAAHAEILAAIERQEPAAAAHAMREHLRGAEQDLGIVLP
ncbi:MAG TPA: FadR/GntR family transcriptional regulator [Thermomicrobiales bacterium]|jgi:GntR family transcriptional repressor for pyruvate dehydrogenase complex